MFVFCSAQRIIIFLLYIDDLIITDSSSSLLAFLSSTLQAEFAMKDLSLLHYFLEMKVSNSTSGVFLTQQKYAHNLLKRHDFSSNKPISTLVLNTNLSAHEGRLLKDSYTYHQIMGLCNILLSIIQTSLMLSTS